MSRPHFRDGSDFCSKCKRMAVEHSHSLTQVLVNAIYDFASKSRSLNSVKLKNLDWSRTRWQNFTKLKYWGLVMQDEPKSGEWRLTEKGLRFLTGEISVPRLVWTWNDSPVEYSKDEFFLADIWPDLPEYMNRRDFAAAARPRFPKEQGELGLL